MARIKGVVKTTSPMRRRRTRRIFTDLVGGWWLVVRRGWWNYPATHESRTTARDSRFYGGLVDEHHRDVVLDRIDAVTLVALECRAVLHEPDGSLTVGTRQNFEELGVDGHLTLRNLETIAFALHSPDVP